MVAAVLVIDLARKATTLRFRQADAEVSWACRVAFERYAQPLPPMRPKAFFWPAQAPAFGYGCGPRPDAFFARRAPQFPLLMRSAGGGRYWSRLEFGSGPFLSQSSYGFGLKARAELRPTMKCSRPPRWRYDQVLHVESWALEPPIHSGAAPYADRTADRALSAIEKC